MPEVKVTNLTKNFGSVVAVDHITFTVEAGEFLTLLGPSGCGKSTTLRLIAGLEELEAGEISRQRSRPRRVYDEDFATNESGPGCALP